MIFHDVQQNTEEWFSLRRGKVTASNFGTFMANEGKAFGEPAKRYAVQVALEQINNVRVENGYTNDHLERGKEQEPIARMLYEDEYFCDVLNGGFFDHGEYGDSPDGLVNNEGAIEIKCVTPAIHYATLKRNSFDPAYTWQLIGHLDCTQRDWVDFVSYCPEFPKEKQLIVYRLNKSDYGDYINRLRNRRNDYLCLVNSIFNDIKK